MTDRTLTALYASRQDAEAARDRLKAAGFEQNVDIHDETSSDRAGPHGDGGFMDKMKEFFGGHEDSQTYGEGVRRGNYLLTVRVEELEAERAAELLDATNAVDLDRSQENWRKEGWTGSAAASSQTGRTGAEEVIPVTEERLQVGKREVERGGVRVRSYVVETPVHEQVSLREEHVSVERRAVDRPASAGDTAFKDRDIELTETAEEAVVAKEAVVREEVVVRKDASERVEQIDDSVRRTEVEVDDTTGRANPAVEKPAQRF